MDLLVEKKNIEVWTPEYPAEHFKPFYTNIFASIGVDTNIWLRSATYNYHQTLWIKWSWRWCTYLLGILIAWKRSNGIWPVVSEWVVKAIAFGTPPPGKVIRSDWNEGVQEKLNKKVLNIWKQTYFVSSVRSSSHTKKMYLGRICWIFKAYLQPHRHRSVDSKSHLGKWYQGSRSKVLAF